VSITVIAIIIFAALFSALIAVLLYFSRSRDRIERRLRDVQDGIVAGEGSAAGSPSLLIAIDPASYTSLRADLTRAGFRGLHAKAWYWFWRVLGALILGGIAFWFQREFISQGAMKILVPAGAALGGFSLPYWVVRGRVQRRRANIQRSIPNVLDLIIVCVEAGLSLNAAIQRISKEMRQTYPELSAELSILNQEFFLGLSRADAFRNLALRTGVDELRSLATVLLQSDKLGTSIAEVLRVQAEILRTKRRQRAMEDAQKMPIKLLFPLILFIFPALLVVILGPAAISLYRSLTDVAR